MQAAAEAVMARDEDDADEPMTAPAADSCRLCGELSVAEHQRHPIVAADETDDDVGTRPGLRDTIVKHLRIQVRIIAPPILTVEYICARVLRSTQRQYVVRRRRHNVQRLIRRRFVVGPRAGADRPHRNGPTL